ncbi:unnamed protein product [Cyclocybe aegerita]|uniref:Uncharacterized protein n=1 Tax=Cyclocybe aegerita TaxID=1973307 RepID=A0A8S0WC95_CYCAE|nr:unnamed protein product [Cyclocybe aegerita]
MSHPAPINLEPLGTWKRKATEKVLNNGDPLAMKRAKPALTTLALKTALTAQKPPTTQSYSARVEDIEDSTDCYHSVPPQNPNCILEAVDGSDDDTIIIEDDFEGLPTLEEVNKDSDDEDEDEDKAEEAEESEEAELERLKKDWSSPVYVFFKTTPSIEYINECRIHVFECAAKHCCGRNGRHVRRYLDTGDAKSMSNLCKHAKICWGDEAVAAADKT